MRQGLGGFAGISRQTFPASGDLGKNFAGCPGKANIFI
ncbi:hypothetical protein L535_4308 [Bordetella bronchiseptica SBL-F6116]|nr:hypothetical protein L535_4308 [Bordetella bronchiseptica SBL-F6116]